MANSVVKPVDIEHIYLWSTPKSCNFSSITANMNISIPQHFSADTYSPYQSEVLFKTEIDVDQKCIDSLFCVLR